MYQAAKTRDFHPLTPIVVPRADEPEGAVHSSGAHLVAKRTCQAAKSRETGPLTPLVVPRADEPEGAVHSSGAHLVVKGM